MSTSPVYEARPIRRCRATQDEMATRRELIIGLAAEHGPCSVRHVFYQAVVAAVPGITKDDAGYQKVQRLVLEQRRSGMISYDSIVDATRWMRKPRTWGSPEEALRATASQYRRDLWRSSDYRVEVWCESDSIASTVHSVTSQWDVPLMVCRGYSSETFAYNAAEAWTDDYRIPVVLYVGDHDPHGLEIEKALRERLVSFSDIEPDWTRVGVTWDQVVEFDLPGTKPKKPYGFPYSVEAEALPPGMLRENIDLMIGMFVDEHELDVLLEAEKSERELLMKMAGVAS